MIEKKASIKDVARLAGVSSATVSHVLNKTRFVSPEVTHRVNEALQASNYNMNSIAKALRINKTCTVGVMTPDISNPFFANVIKNIEITLNEFGYNIILSHSSEDPVKEKEHLDMLMNWSIDGLAIIPATTCTDYTIIKCPAVFIDRKPENQEFSGVFTDSHEILRYSVEQLIKKGHQKIGFISVHPRFSTHLDRMNGYLDALRDSGIPANLDYILQGNPSPADGYSAIRKLMEQTDITAVVIANNRMGIGAVRYFTDHHIEIPKRMAVIVFSDYEWATLTVPQISCIAQPMEEIGTTAARMLLDKIENRYLMPNQITVNCELIQRGSF